MSLFSGQHLTDRNIELRIHEKVKTIVMRLQLNQIDEADAIRQLTDVLVRAVHATARIQQHREEEQ